MGGPAISLSILNHQRRETLRQCLERGVSQDHPAFEVLVVDNASTYGSDAMVGADFPAVRLIRMPRNVGCAARNAGVEAAHGRIVVTLDNDVLLEGPDALRRIEALFATQPGLACANFRILDGEGRLSRRDWCHPRELSAASEPFPTDYVLEGACAFRRDAFLASGGYWEPLFLGHEGLDLALRLINAGSDLLYWPGVSVRHLVSAEARPSSRIYYTFTRNSIWIALRNHRVGAAVLAVAKDMVLMGVSSLRAGELGSFLRGAVDGINGIRTALATRQSLEAATYRRLRELRREAPGFVAKARRHLVERPI